MKTEQTKEVTISEEIEKISAYAFEGRYDLKVFNIVNIQKRIYEIDEGAFLECVSLEKINTLKGLLKIGKYAFEGCISLIITDLPEGLKKIDRWAFSRCSSIKKMVLPKSLEEIGEMAFSYSGLEEVIFKGIIKEIGEDPFYDCYRLKRVYYGGPKTPEAIEMFEQCRLPKKCKVI